jgi:hypothetical protein
MRRRRKKQNGWAARRSYQRQADKIARSVFGYRDQRAMTHARQVERLREILEAPADSAECESFTTKVVADAIGGSPKAIRWLVCTRAMNAKKLRGDKARKFWFEAGSVRKYLYSCRHFSNLPDQSGVFRSEKISANPAFMKGEGITKSRAATELKLTNSGVEYHLKHGNLKRLPSSSRITLISQTSLAKLCWKRRGKAERAYKFAQLKFERAQKRRKNICGE